MSKSDCLPPSSAKVWAIQSIKAVQPLDTINWNNFQKNLLKEIFPGLVPIKARPERWGNESK